MSSKRKPEELLDAYEAVDRRQAHVCSLCPACGVEFKNKIPKRKTRCNACQQILYVRRGILTTEKEAMLCDWIQRMSQLGTALSDWRTGLEQLRIKMPGIIEVNDLIWQVLQNTLLKAALDGKAAGVYSLMAMFARYENRDFRKYEVFEKTESLKSIAQTTGKLNAIRPFGEWNVQISGIDDDRQCSGCKELNKKIIPLATARNELPIPTQCTNKIDGCRCLYVINT